MKLKHIISATLSCLIISSCWDWVEYTAPTTEAMTAATDEDGLLPQEGTTLHLTLNYGPVTKWEPGHSWKWYRYRVFVDGELYSKGIISEEGYYDVFDIPLIANDSHSVRTVTAEGSMALDFDSGDKWDEWHKLYEAQQACLPDDQPLQYAELENARLIMRIKGKQIPFVMDKNGAAEAFKRLFYEHAVVFRVQVNNDGIPFDWSSQGEMLNYLRASIPQYHDENRKELKAGEVYFGYYGFSICLKDQDISGRSYLSTIGHVSPESADLLYSLASGAPYGYTDIIFSLENKATDVLVEWAYNGWDDVYNDLDEVVAFATCDDENDAPLFHYIEPGEYLRLNAGCFVPGESIREHDYVFILVSNYVFTDRLYANGDEPWNKHFFTNYTEEKITEQVNVAGFTLDHTYYTRKYHIDRELLDLYPTVD